MERQAGRAGAGQRWASAGHEGRREAAAVWEEREAALRAQVGGLWAEHAEAFADYWRELHRDPDATLDLRQALLLTALHDLLHHHEEDEEEDQQEEEEETNERDNGTEDDASVEEGRGGGEGAGRRRADAEMESALRAVAMGACPELFEDVSVLLASPDRLVGLLSEPYAADAGHLRAQREEEGTCPQRTDRAEYGAAALGAARRWCLLQLGCNLVLLFLHGAHDDTEGHEDPIDGS